MHECYAMQILETKRKTQKPKNNGNKDRKSVVQGKSVYAGVDLGGRRIIKKIFIKKKHLE